VGSRHRRPRRPGHRLAGLAHGVRLPHPGRRARHPARPQPVRHQARRPSEARDGTRTRDLCFGTVDTWLAWTLSDGRLHVTDPSNAAVTGLLDHLDLQWSDHVLETLRIPRSCLPTIVDSSGAIGEASALDGAPPIAALVGDQQGSLIGQGCVRPGLTKITFGTGGMLDTCTGPAAPGAPAQPHGTFPSWPGPSGAS
jgi:glycerol kinase